MANEQQLKVLEQGVVAWNQWRRENPKVLIELQGADLMETNLSSANLEGGDLAGANLRRANLSRTNLQESMLGAANLSEADLTGANLKGAFLNEADLSLVSGLTQQQIDSTRSVDYAKLPAHIRGRQSTVEQRAKELQDLGLGGQVVIMGRGPIMQKKQKKWWQFWKK